MSIGGKYISQGETERLWGCAAGRGLACCAPSRSNATSLEHRRELMSRGKHAKGAVRKKARYAHARLRSASGGHTMRSAFKKKQGRKAYFGSRAGTMPTVVVRGRGPDAERSRGAMCERGEEWREETPSATTGHSRLTVCGLAGGGRAGRPCILLRAFICGDIDVASLQNCGLSGYPHKIWNGPKTFKLSNSNGEQQSRAPVPAPVRYLYGRASGAMY